LVLDSTILENIPMESNHQLNRNITLSDVAVVLLVPLLLAPGTAAGHKLWITSRAPPIAEGVQCCCAGQRLCVSMTTTTVSSSFSGHVGWFLVRIN
jgi:hypothetical protein